MADNWLIEQRIDLRRGVQAPQVWPHALMLRGDNNAHTWRVIVLDGGEPAQITGNITGYFVRADGNTVVVTGELSGHIASVTLAQACYAIQGDLRAVMRLKVGESTITLSALILHVRSEISDSIIDPGEVIPSLDDLLAQIDACEEATDAANDAADAANQAAQSASAVESDIESAEAARVTAEQGRVAAEQARAAAEAERVANEDERQQQLTDAINAAEADADRAEAAADAAETLIAMPPLFSDTPPADEPTLNKLWVDTGVSPTMMRRWRGADVTTEREYTETRVGCGKNLLSLQTPQTKFGVTIAVQADGGVHISGTCTAASGPVTFEYPVNMTLDGEFTLSMGNSQAVADHLQMRLTDGPGATLYDANGTSSNIAAQNANSAVTLELNHQYVYGWIIRVGGGETYDVTLYPQLERGETATAFEPYEDIPFLALDNAQGQISQVKVEVGCDVTSKNMIDINSLTATTNTNISVTTDQVRVYTTGEGGTWKGGSTKSFVLRKGVPYTLSAQLVEYVSGDAYVAIRNASDNNIISALSLDFGTTPATMSKTYTPDSNMRVYFTAFCSNNSVLTGDVTYRGIQLEVGDEATAYESYKGLGGKDQISIVACGKNLINLDDLYLPNSNTEMSESEDSVRIYTTGDGGTYRGARTPAFWIRKGVSYTLSAELANYVSGHARAGLRNAGTGTFLDETTVIFGSTPGTLTKTFTPESDEEVYFSALCTNSTVLVGDCTFADIQLEIGNSATEYEPYLAMGGGMITPDKPLYGLPGAKDTVEVSVDGDVLATRRTGVVVLDGTETWGAYATAVSGEMRFRLDPGATPGIQPPPDNNTAANLLCSHYLSVPATTGGTYERVAGISVHASEKAVYIYDEQYSDGNVEAWKAYLAAQYAAGTPVTLVYALAAPEAEALTAVAPIAPEPGQLNICADADALTATIYGSGWDTISDQTGLLATIAQLTARVAALEQAAVNESTGG